MTLSGGGGTEVSQATATAHVSGGVITSISGAGGRYYESAPTVTITDPTGTGATATASMLSQYGPCSYRLIAIVDYMGYDVPVMMYIAGSPPVFWIKLYEPLSISAMSAMFPGQSITLTGTCMRTSPGVPYDIQWGAFPPNLYTRAGD